MTGTTEPIRLLDLTILDGARQLAMTEAIMTAVGKGIAPPTLRLYSWFERVLILGVGQPASDLDLNTCRDRGYRILRRIGGGSAVYHDEDEVSVDLILPAGHRLAPTDVHAGYQTFARFLADGLERLGIDPEVVTVEQARAFAIDEQLRPICFASISPGEFLHKQRKLNGLCQIRRREVVAFQAAIYNRFHTEPLIAALNHADQAIRAQRMAKLQGFVTDMASARGSAVDYRVLQSSLSVAAVRTLRVQPAAGTLTPFETAETERLIRQKYACDDWTFRR